MQQGETGVERPTRLPPTWILVVAGVSLAAAVSLMVAGALAVGTTWDEGVQVLMLQTFLEQGWHMTPDALISGIPDPGYYYGSFVYGPVGELVPHLVNVVLGNESWGQTSLESAAYAGRHLGVALLALVGVGAVGVTTGIVTRSWRWGILAATCLAIVPLWLGHGMFNIKDTPAATGYTVATLGLVTLARTDYFSRRWVHAVALGSLIVGAVLAAGTRTALGLPIAASVVLGVGLSWLLLRRTSREQARQFRASRRFVEAFLAMVVAYLILLAIYPKAYSNPINLGIKAILDSAAYPVHEAQLTAGTWMTQPVSWTYLPLWFGAQLPLIIIVFAIVGVAWWLWSVVGILRGTVHEPSPVEGASMTWPVVIQMTLLPAATIAGHATLYNGTRQMQFVIPAAAILTALGIRVVARRLTNRVGSAVLWGLVTLGLVVPLAAQARLFPYNYSYYNAVAALAPIDGNWPTDYWRASGRELITRTPTQGEVSCGTEQLDKGDFYPCPEQPMFAPYLDGRGSAAIPADLGPTQYWFIRENGGNLEIPPGCTTHDTITRRLFWRDITIGQVLICDSTISTGRRNMADPSQPVS